MSTPQRAPVWTLNANSIQGGPNGQLLVGCHITENQSQTAYEFTEPNINKILSFTPEGSLPPVPFTFPSFDHKGFNWTITVTSLGVGATITGTWNTAATPPDGMVDPTPPQSGDYTAQTGGTMDPEEAASSAKAYGTS